MRFARILPALWLACSVQAADKTTTTDTTASSSSASGSAVAADAIPTSVTYQDATTTVTLSSSPALTVVNGSITITVSASDIAAGNTSSTATTTSESLTVLSGGQATSSGNMTGNATATATSAAATNTQPCNGYAEFCERKWGNITWVAAHNSPFVKPGNAASNQELKVTTQLNDGIRMLQLQTHYVNDTVYMCHTSCDLLNMGPLEDYLTTVTTWLAEHPYDVVSILLGNGDVVKPQRFVDPVTDSGLIKYVYTPPKIPMAKSDWPTLAEFIITGKRAIMFLDYEANQTAIPWLQDEFTQIWETPFSPTNPEFPCTEQRPPNLNETKAKNRLYMANHNLNTEVSIAGASLLLPNTAEITVTNSVDDGNSSLGAMAERCYEKWGSPPNFLLVDYYNYGNFNGSVFQVAANWNNVTYDKSSCCGTTSTSAGVVVSWDRMLVGAACLVAVFWSL